MKTRKPVIIIGGFLGSGKTTLLNKLLKSPGHKRYAVIVNELGSIGLDASLMGNEPDFVKLDNGCLCCSLNEDLALTAQKLATRDDYDAVVIETTGIADPLPVAWTFFREATQHAFRFGGIITVVDALNFETMSATAEEPTLQVERGDFLYLAKTDLATADLIQKLKTKLQNTNPNSRIIDQNDPAALSLLFETELTDTPHNGFLAAGHHTTAYQTVSYSLEGKKISREKLEDFFETLPHEIFRAKAVFCDELTQEMIAMHSVCGRVESEVLPERAKLTEALVLIGKNFDEEELEKAWNKIVIPVKTGIQN